MMRIDVKSKTGNYPVIIGFGLLKKVNYFFKKSGIKGRCVLICNQALYNLYGKTLVKNLGNNTEILIIEDGENVKSLETAKKLYDQLIRLDMNRDSTIIALGGGVTGDLAGYVAATYLRGINLVHIPTSLVAQIDSSIGGKVGVNYRNIKNAIGSFYPPKLVLTDIKTLKTLPEEEFNNGMAEVIKSAVIRNESLFQLIKRNSGKIKRHESDTMLKLITKTCKIKISIIERDEREKGIRKVLNFGHTFGHPLEMLHGYKHGGAISLGMMMATRVAKNLNILEDYSLPQQLESTLKMFNLPTECPKLGNNYWDLLSKDKKREETAVFILPEKIGIVKVMKSSVEEIRKITKQ
jgi:3-dehydroquinate synthase